MTDRSPIEILPHDPAWRHEFEAERRSLEASFAPMRFSIEHIGSTSVLGLAAKPIIDIMLGCQAIEEFEAFLPNLVEAGWEYVSRFEVEFPERRFLAKPNAPPRRVHLHAVALSTPFWRDHIVFRDILRGSPQIAFAYENLKRGLAAQFVDDREGYSHAKGDFIQSVLRQA